MFKSQMFKQMFKAAAFIPQTWEQTAPAIRIELGHRVYFAHRNLQTRDLQFRHFLKRRRDFLVTVAIAVVATAIAYPFSAGGIQRRNMAKARAHIPIVRRALETDPRFARVRLSDFTANQGCHLVSGTVPTRADMNRLEDITASTSPPTPVRFAAFSDDELSHLRTELSRQ